MIFNLSAKSQLKIRDIHPDMQKVVQLAIKKTVVDFTVLEGIRTLERQKELLAAGATQTLNSRHLTGHAVDLGAIVGGKITWQPAVYDKIANAMLEAAAMLGIPIVWGGSWLTFKDLVHFELNRKFYP